MGLTPVVLFIWCRQWMMDGSRADFGSEWTGPCAHYFFGIGLIFVIVALGAPLGAAFEGYPGRFCMLIFLSTLAAMVGTTCYASGGDEGFGEPEHGEGLRCPTKKSELLRLGLVLATYGTLIGVAHLRCGACVIFPLVLHWASVVLYTIGLLPWTQSARSLVNISLPSSASHRADRQHLVAL
jgi:hypothetical protein